jgi:hypothetical protein
MDYCIFAERSRKSVTVDSVTGCRPRGSTRPRSSQRSVWTSIANVTVAYNLVLPVMIKL